MSEFISRLPSHYIVIKSSINLVLEVFWIPIEKIMSYGNSCSFAFILYNLDPFALLSNFSGLEPAAQCGIEFIKAIFYLVPDHKGKIFNFIPLSMILAVSIL